MCPERETGSLLERKLAQLPCRAFRRHGI